MDLFLVFLSSVIQYVVGDALYIANRPASCYQLEFFNHVMITFAILEIEKKNP